ncbi:MAG TPA: ABC transporter substrate binding protein [Nitrospiraceae bacterium]|nr:ABC transporter substrate binding protein [Nitrospiraceae bacterium]
MYVVEDAFFTAHRTRLVKLASKSRLPIISAARQYPDEGGLMSYGANFGDLWRRSATYVDKILKQPTKFELVVNLKTAKALGLTIPEPILLRADEVFR